MLDHRDDDRRGPKMRTGKTICLIVCAASLIFVYGCKNNEDTTAGNSNEPEVSSPEVNIPEVNEPEVNEPEVNEPEVNIPVDDNGIDVDLTALSSTMVYAEVYNMMVTPENYIGKTVKMDGMFVPLHDDTTGKDYYACVIQDATACCAQGIEFEATEEYKYPDDYPEEGGEICVVGTFDTYMEGENRYCTLKNATID